MNNGLISKLDKRLLNHILFGIFIIFYGFYLHFYSMEPFDDAYIHMRIARNFANFGMPYYNVTEHIISSSSHIWVLLQSVLFFIFPKTLGTVVWFQFALFLLLALKLRRLFELRYSPIQSTLLSFGLIQIFLFSAFVGLMESVLGCLFFLLFFYHLKIRNQKLAYFFLALSIFTRNEFFLMWLVSLLYFYKDRDFWKISILTALPFLIYLFSFYGTFIPQPAMAKQMAGVVGFATKGVGFLLDYWALGFLILHFPGFGVFESSVFTNLFFMLLCFIPFFLILYKWHKQNLSVEIKISLLGSLFIFVSYLVGNTHIYNWYWPNIFFPLAICFLFVNWKKEVLFILPLFTAKLVISLLSILGFITENKNFHTTYKFNSRVHTYKEISSFLKNANMNENDQIMVNEVGLLGWELDRNIFGNVGLVNKDAFEIIRENYKTKKLRTPDSAEDILKKFKPKYFIFNFDFTKKRNFKSILKENGYEPIETFALKNPMLRTKEFILFRRR